jgi:hypothetical protein
MGTTLHKYLCKVLRENTAKKSTHKMLDDVFWHIRRDLAVCNKMQARFYKGGSAMKKTMIDNKPDLDMIIYFPCDSQKSPKELQDFVRETLASLKYEIEEQVGASIPVVYNSKVDVDIVVARAKKETFIIAETYNYKTSLKMKTSRAAALKAIKGIPHIIRLMKVWRTTHNIKWHKLAIEEFVARILENVDKNDLGKCFEIILDDIKKNMDTIKFKDPANSNNPILVHDRERQNVKTLATQHLEYINNGEFDKVFPI